MTKFNLDLFDSSLQESIIWLWLVAYITSAMIGWERDLRGHYTAVMPTGRLRIMQIRKSQGIKCQTRAAALKIQAL